jgi:hypothetical protein
MSTDLKVAKTKYRSKGSHEFDANHSLLLTVNRTESASILRQAFLEARVRVDQQDARRGSLSLRCESTLPELIMTRSSAHNACTQPLGVRSRRMSPAEVLGGSTMKHPALARAQIARKMPFVEYPFGANGVPLRTTFTSVAFKLAFKGGQGLILPAKYPCPETNKKNSDDLI